MKNLDKNLLYKIELKRDLNKDITILRTERKTLSFIPGQYIYVGLPGASDVKPYSIYSGINDPYLEILIKKVEHGAVSNTITQLKTGDYLEILEPKGHFCIPQNYVKGHKLVFVATGVGIAPFRSYVRSYPELNFKIYHGVRDISEKFDVEDYPNGSYFTCTSRDNSGDFKGRVTDFFKTNNPDFDVFFLCGNGAMVKEMIAILANKGIKTSNIRTEIFY
jgi:NAD(P)H-flavin reductase